MPDVFSHLIHLRNLKINGYLQQFPRSLCKLYHLQAIKFNYRENTIKFPESMNKLVNLRHLSANHQVARVGKLIFLQELSFFVKTKRGYKIEELRYLIWLRSLDVKGLENVENQEEANMAKFCEKKYLQTLCLGWSINTDLGMDKHELVLDLLEPLSNLKDLRIDGYRGIRYANWMEFELINNLQCICLSNCPRLDHLPPLGRLPFLKKFKVKNMPAIKKLDYQSQHLKSLEICDVEGLEELTGSGVDADQWHPHLHTLVVVSCPKLEVMPSLSLSIRKIRLQNLGLASLPTLWLDRSSMCITGGSLSSSSSSLEVLEIWNCQKIRSLDKGLITLQHHLTSLKRLEICYCQELVDFPSGGLQHLRALKELMIMCCPKLQVADPAPSTSYGNDEKFLPMSLRSLDITRCGELVRRFPALLKGFVSLDLLTLRYCEELMSLEGLMRLQSIRRLHIKGCPKLGHTASPGTVGSNLTSSIDSLSIDDPSLLVSGVLRSVTLVRDLLIRNLGGIEDLSTLEQWMLQNQTTLEVLRMGGASSLKSLPDSFRNLSSLKALEINRASETLIERCRKDEGADWPNISHIPTIIIDGCERDLDCTIA